MLTDTKSTIETVQDAAAALVAEALAAGHGKRATIIEHVTSQLVAQIEAGS